MPVVAMQRYSLYEARNRKCRHDSDSRQHKVDVLDIKIWKVITKRNQINFSNDIQDIEVGQW